MNPATEEGMLILISYLKPQCECCTYSRYELCKASYRTLLLPHVRIVRIYFFFSSEKPWVSIHYSFVCFLHLQNNGVIFLIP